VIISMLYTVARRLLSFPGVLLRGDTAKDAELLVLQHENADGVLDILGLVDGSGEPPRVATVPDRDNHVPYQF
jgi:hypothetical protein